MTLPLALILSDSYAVFQPIHQMSPHLLKDILSPRLNHAECHKHLQDEDGTLIYCNLTWCTRSLYPFIVF